ncbi:hypothetical protein [Tropicimonas sp. S265A]
MSTKKKGVLTVSAEWRKHLRPFYKRIFWKKERRTANRVAKRDSWHP